MEEVRRTADEWCLMKRVRRRQLKFLGQIVRSQELESVCPLGTIDGTRARGRQRMKYMDSILSFLGGGQTTASMLRLARERRNWRSMVDNITR